MTVIAIEHIAKKETVKAGAPYIVGHGIPVHHIVVLHDYQGSTPEVIAHDLDLTLGQVYAALSYYYDHQEEIDGITDEEERAYQDGLTVQKISADTGVDLIGTADVAAMLGFSKDSRRVAQLCREGKLDCTKIANRWLITRKSALAYARTNAGPGRPPTE